MKYRKIKPKASNHSHQSQSNLLSQSTREKVREQAMTGFDSSDTFYSLMSRNVRRFCLIMNETRNIQRFHSLV